MNIKFDTDNAAFDDEGGGDMRAECSRIIRELAERIENGSEERGALYDINGNRVGEWSL